MVTIAKLLSLHANHFMWFLAINPHYYPVNRYNYHSFATKKKKKRCLRLKEVKYLSQSHASLAGVGPRQLESRTNTLEDSAETSQMQGYQQKNPLAPSCAVGSAVSDSSSLIGGISEKRVDNQFEFHFQF